eukprot:362837-Chlamydomonas_euryale.AAC.7
MEGTVHRQPPSMQARDFRTSWAPKRPRMLDTAARWNTPPPRCVPRAERVTTPPHLACPCRPPSA